MYIVVLALVFALAGVPGSVGAARETDEDSSHYSEDDNHHYFEVHDDDGTTKKRKVRKGQGRRLPDGTGYYEPDGFGESDYEPGSELSLEVSPSAGGYTTFGDEVDPGEDDGEQEEPDLLEGTGERPPDLDEELEHLEFLLGTTPGIGCPEGDSSESVSSSMTEVCGSIEPVPDNLRLAAPRRAVVHIEFQKNDGRWYGCSGWLFREDRVVTNAHCLYDREARVWYPRHLIRVTPARRDNEFPFGQCGVTTRRIWAGYLNAPWPDEWDFGVMRLNCDLRHVGWFGFVGPNTDPRNDGRTRGFVTGYPGGPRMGESSGDIWWWGGDSGQVVFYTNSTMGGMSGGPRYNRRYLNNCACVHAINRSGGDRPDNNFGQGVLITPRVRDLLIDAKNNW